MVMKRTNKNKTFWVVAYDITNDLRRSRIVKIIEKSGVRVNYSVFECMLTESQLEKLQEKIAKIINPSEDRIIFYPLCVNCYSKIIYTPNHIKRPEVIKVI